MFCLDLELRYLSIKKSIEVNPPILQGHTFKELLLQTAI